MWVYLLLILLGIAGMACFLLLLRCKHQLVLKNRELTKELESQKQAFVKTNSKLEEEKNVKNILLSLIGHDLSNQLMMVNLYLKKVEEDFTHKERIKKIIKQSILSLNNVKMLRSIQNESYQMNLELVTGLEIVEQLQPLIEFYDMNCDVNIKVKNELDLDVKVRVDLHTLVNHVLSNLISNAVKFSPKGRDILIEILEDSPHVLLSIQDQGPGLPEEVQEYLQNDKDDSEYQSQIGLRGERGTGLGLTLVKYFTYQRGPYHSECRKGSRLEDLTAFKSDLKPYSHFLTSRGFVKTFSRIIIGTTTRVEVRNPSL